MISALTGKYPCFGVKWFPLLFSLQSISGLRRAKRERERREIETQKRTPTNPDTDSDEPKNWLRLTQKTQDRARSSSNAQTHSSNPENPFDRTISDPHRADRTTGEIVTPQHRSTKNRSFSSHPKIDRSCAIFVGYWEFGFCFFWVLMNLGFVLDPASSSLTQIRRPRPSFVIPIHQSLSLSLSIWSDLMNFFCWDLFLLCLFTEKWY